MKEKTIKKMEDNKYVLYMILFLVIFHIICNINIKTISFSSDEYIPLSIAAKFSGLDWMNSRSFNYYYGYITLLFFIPFFKIPFIYNNSFLLTQAVLSVNSIFHILSTVIIYYSAIMLFEKTDKKIIAVVSLISTCSLQVFNISMGIQIESLFVLAYAVCFYILLKLVKYNVRLFEIVLLSFFSYVAIANNSRGYVLLISLCICIALLCIKDKKNSNYLIGYILFSLLFLSIHKFIINPEYSKFFIDNAFNTSSQPIIDSFKLILSDRTYLKGFFKACLGWIWSCNISTFGLFFITLIMIFQEYKSFIKEKKIEKIIIPSFILLNIIGISVLCVTMCIGSIVSSLYEGVGSRADVVFYVRYFVAILTIADVYALYSLIEKKILCKKAIKIIYGGFVVLSSIAVIYFIGIPIIGERYGVNNSVFVSLFLKGFDESFRYGYIDISRFYVMCLFICIVAGSIVLFAKDKKIVLTILSVLTFATCLIYTDEIANNKSAYYDNIFDENVIDACNKEKKHKIYVSDFAPVLQYKVPDAKICYKFENQDFLIMTEEKSYLLDQADCQYEYLVTYNQWNLFKKVK